MGLRDPYRGSQRDVQRWRPGVVALAFNHSAQEIEASLVHRLSSRLTKAIYSETLFQKQNLKPPTVAAERQACVCLCVCAMCICICEIYV